MLDKLKKLKELQGKLKEEKVTVDKNGTKITINGHMKIQNITINKDRSSEDLEKDIKEGMNEATDKIKDKLKGSLM